MLMRHYLWTKCDNTDILIFGLLEDENQNKARVWGKSGTGRSQNSLREITGKVRTMPGGKFT